jgi:hypothetical protein
VYSDSRYERYARKNKSECLDAVRDKLISVSKQSKNGAKPVTSIYEQLGVMREEAIEYEARTINYPSNFLSVGLPGCTDCSRLAKEEYWMISLRRHDDSFARCRS